MKGKALTRQRSSPTACCAAVLGVLSLGGPAAWGARWPARMQQTPAPIERRSPGPRAMAPEGRAGGGVPGQRNSGVPRGEHLAEWMNQHSSLTPEQQQSALGNEPGFRDLPQQTQQRMRNRLSQLDAMNPDKRQRVLARTEAMERLTPDQRADVRGAMGQLGGLPVEERRQVARTFRALRALPPEQRIGAYATGRYGPQLNDSQRSVLFNLLRVEPMLPPPAGPAPAQPLR